MRNVLGLPDSINHSYEDFEISTDLGEPIELYYFTYKGANGTRIWAYTSALRKQIVSTPQLNRAFEPVFIQRGESLSQDSSGGAIETCTITVDSANPVSQLYLGAPPEDDSVTVNIWRIHNNLTQTLVKICDGIVSQVRWYDAYAELTITIENVLSRYIPRGTLSYWCQNNIYDDVCRVNPKDFEKVCVVNTIKGTTIISNSVLDKEEDYYTNGYIVMGNAKRGIFKHIDNRIILKYPISEDDIRDTFFAYPGCRNTFGYCASRFNNTVNFSGIPYIQPYNAVSHPVDKGAYWVNGNIVYRDTDGTLHQVTEDTENLFRGTWSSEREYKINDRVRYGDSMYKCVVSHTSGESFNDDFEAGYWVLENTDPE